MRIFMIFAITAIVVAIGYEAGHAYFARSHAVSSVAAVPSTMSPHDIHLNYKRMKSFRSTTSKTPSRLARVPMTWTLSWRHRRA